MILGLILSLASALGTNFGFLFKQRGAVAAPPVRVRHPLRSAGELFRSKWFAIGWIVSLAAWGAHVGALSLAPLSTVQAVLSGGLVFLAVLAERFFGNARHDRRRTPFGDQLAGTGDALGHSHPRKSSPRLRAPSSCARGRARGGRCAGAAR